MTEQTRTEFKEMLQEAIEVGVQQRSGSHSDILAKLTRIEKRMEALEATMNGWKMGGKIAFGMLVVTGGLITWILKTFGIKIGLR